MAQGYIEMVQADVLDTNTAAVVFHLRQTNSVQL